MKKDDIKFWRKTLRKIADEVGKAISPFIGAKKSAKVVKMGADGTPTKYIDIVAENKVIEILENTNRPITLVSEEIGEFKILDKPSEVILVVDPLDGTNNAIKNIPFYGISIAVADASKNPLDELTINDIEIGIVKNFATNDIYEAVKNEGSWINGNRAIPSQEGDISKFSVGAYIRRAKIERINNLCNIVRKVRILGSVAIELCYVANGTFDAFLDIRGNLRIIDIAAAKLIVEEAGCIVTDEKGINLNGKLNVKERTSVIAACNPQIHKEIIKLTEVS